MILAVKTRRIGTEENKFAGVEMCILLATVHPFSGKSFGLSMFSKCATVVGTATLTFL